MGKEGVEVIVHAIVFNLLVCSVILPFRSSRMNYVVSEISAVWGTLITLALLWIALILLKYSKDASKLTDLIDLTNSYKVFAYSSVLLGFSSVYLDYLHSNAFLVPAGVSYLVWALVTLRELYIKYLKPYIKASEFA